MREYLYKTPDGRTGNVYPVRWKWIAIYDDGSELYQYDDKDMTYHKIAEIDESKLVKFIMTNGTIRYIVEFQPDMKLIHYYQHRVSIPLAEGMAGGHVQTFCFGWESDVRGRNEKCVMEICPNDELKFIAGDPSLLDIVICRENKWYHNK